MNKKVKMLIWAAALVVVLGGAAWGYRALSQRMNPSNPFDPPKESSSHSDAERPPVPAPDFSLQNAQGEDVTFAELAKGKAVVINFWATWCTYCVQEMPDFQRVYEEFGDDVLFMMINATDGVNETKTKAREFIEEKGFTFPIFYDVGIEACTAYGVNAFPSTVFVNPDGTLAAGIRGQISEATLREGVEMVRQGADHDKK